MATFKAAASAAILAGLTAVADSPSVPAFQAPAVPAAVSAVETALEPVIATATNAEPWYRSRVTWGAILSAVLPLLAAMGADTGWLDPDTGGLLLASAGSLIGAALTLYGRWKARKPLFAK